MIPRASEACLSLEDAVVWRRACPYLYLGSENARTPVEAAAKNERDATAAGPRAAAAASPARPGKQGDKTQNQRDERQTRGTTQKQMAANELP